MKKYTDYYFKWAFDEKGQYMSGLHLPNPDKGPYEFQDCNIHPRLWETLKQLYLPKGSIITGSTYIG
jgi:hypothetical protein